MYALAINKYGGPENFELIKTSSPALGENQVRVGIKGTSVNPVDYKIRRGDYKYLTGYKFPLILGTDFSGVVLESNNPKYKPGMKVFGFADPFKGGAYADEIVTEEENLGMKPDNISFAHAATLPFVGLAACEALCRHGKIKEEKSVLINGCTGGVGTMAVQIARIYTDNITAVCSTRNLGYAESMGIENILNYEVDTLDHSEKYDIIYDTIGNLRFGKIKKLLKNGGIFLSNAFTFPMYIQGLIYKQCKRVMVVPDSKLLGLITCLVDQNMLSPVVEETFSWKDMAKAHTLAEKGKVRGKIAIEID